MPVTSKSGMRTAVIRQSCQNVGEATFISADRLRRVTQPSAMSITMTGISLAPEATKIAGRCSAITVMLFIYPLFRGERPGRDDLQFSRSFPA